MRDEIFQLYSKDYRSFHNEDHAELDDDELNEMELRSNTAAEVLQGLFFDHEEFFDDDATSQFMKDASEKGDAYVLQTFRNWTNDLLSGANAKDDTVQLNASNVEELADVIEPYVKTAASLDEDDRPVSYWPLVRLVRYG